MLKISKYSRILLSEHRMINYIRAFFSKFFLNKMFKEFFRYGFVGINALILEVVLISILVKIGIYPEYSRIISIPIAISFTWYFNRRFTFKNKNPKKVKQYSKYFLVILCGIAINYSVYIYFLNFFMALEYAYIIALCLGSLSSMLFNFGLSKFVIFKKIN